jgi:hypothetical protein
MVRRWPWLALLTLAACVYDIDDELCLRDDHCDDGAVCAVNNRCVVCQGDGCPPSERCHADADCDDDEVCADDRICRTRCVIDAQCPQSGDCREPVCAAAFGEACTDDDYETSTTCAGECISTNNQLETVPSYCSARCLPELCPDGYECVADHCRIIEGSTVCQHPSPFAPCGGCAWEYCGTDLDDCCEGAICGDVLNQIAVCDANRDNLNCAPLAFPYNFTSTSTDLAECIELFCGDGVCFAE